MKIEYRIPEPQMFSHEEVGKILKEDTKYFEDNENPVIEILHDDVVVHRTRKLAKVQRLFLSLLEDLQKVKG